MDDGGVAIYKSINYKLNIVSAESFEANQKLFMYTLEDDYV